MVTALKPELDFIGKCAIFVFSELVYLSCFLDAR